ncbi:DinB family protein [Fulvivirga ligni]|uniref:DinB family protein n=1 Tax=Fulvivirga ligni TaxID=2904246 RepID=UPI001F2373C7|nr:DinB family protein [Fulvivirga ligni]UII20216.1 DinB family protein [Fulvivirga ligni]
MKTQLEQLGRRNFLRKSSLLPLGASALFSSGFTTKPHASAKEEINIIGPKEGFSPQVGTLVSMMNWMRMVILGPVKEMTQEQLDFLLDDDSNSVGAMLMHLAATERFYQINTFEGRAWGDWDKADEKRWSVASGLGDEARKKIKGNDINYYLTQLEEVREHSLKEFAKRDDDWLMTVDEKWPWGPTNNYCKWFHVCEHESNHNGQVKFLKSRMPA